jgi:hypothetical protein
VDEGTIRCTLLPVALRERRRLLLAPLRARAGAVERLADGWRLHFAPADDLLAQLAELIDLERRCCAFLRFELNVEPEGGPVTLALRGPEGAAAFLATELGLADG